MIPPASPLVRFLRQSWPVIAAFALIAAALIMSAQLNKTATSSSKTPSATQGSGSEAAPPATSETPGPSLVGTAAYAFSAPDVDTGKTVSLADFRGKTAVVIDFYQNDCDTCRIGFPHLVELSKTYQGKGIEFIGIPLETEKPAAGQWKKEYKADFPFLFDPGFTIAKAFQVKVTPTTFFIDRDGKIVQSIISYDQGTFDKAIRALGPTS